MDRLHFKRGKRVPRQYVLWCLSERHLTSAIDLFKAINFCWSSLDFRTRRKQMVYFIRSRYNPTWEGIAGHINIIKWTQSETDLCASASSQNLQNQSVRWKITCICPFWNYISWTWIKYATGVVALSKTRRKGKLLISSLHSDIWSFCTLTDPLGRNYESYMYALKYISVAKEQLRTFKVKLTSFLYRLKLFSLDLF